MQAFPGCVCGSQAASLGGDADRGSAVGMIRRAHRLRYKRGLAQVVVHNSIAKAAAHVAGLQDEGCINSRCSRGRRGLVAGLGITNVEGRVQRSRFDSRGRNISGDRCAASEQRQRVAVPKVASIVSRSSFFWPQGRVWRRVSVPPGQRSLLDRWGRLRVKLARRAASLHIILNRCRV